MLKTLKTLTSGQPEKYSRCHKTWFQWKPSPTFEIYIVYIAHWDRLTQYILHIAVWISKDSLICHFLENVGLAVI